MILKRIEIENFRQFAMAESIDFSTDKVKNITVIHGENGSGKTTLLQAFLWVLYGKINLPEKDFVFNKNNFNNTKINSTLETQIRLYFNHDNSDYELLRKQEFVKLGDYQFQERDQFLTLRTKKANGDTTILRSREIERLFPEKLSAYFFFDGERIKNLGNYNEGAKEDIKDAIHSILGLKHVLNTIDHMGGKTGKAGVIKMYQDDLAQLQISNRLYTASNDEKNKLVDEVELLVQSLTETNDSIGELKKTLFECEEILDANKESKTWQRERKNKEELINSKKSNIDEYRNNIISQISSEKSLLFYSRRILEKAEKNIQEVKIVDEVVDGININTINQIIQRGYCICSTKIFENSQEHKQLEDLKKYVPPQSYATIAKQIKTNLKKAQNKSVNFKSEIEIYDLKIQKEEIAIADLLEELNDLSKKIEKIDISLISNTEIKRSALKSEIEKKIKKTGEIEKLIKDKTSRINELEKKMNTNIIVDKKNEAVSKKIQIVEKMIEVLKRLFDDKEKEIKENLGSKIKQIFDEISHKNYEMILCQDYSFKVIDKAGMQVALSEGERQIAALSFIGALVDIAREKIEELNDSLIETQESYPLVMDSPFGTLDSHHRSKVATLIPRLCDQVVLFASSTQYKGEVEESTKGFVGKEYRIEHCSEKDFSVARIMEEVR